MVKLFTFVRRRTGMAPAEFHEHWRSVHAATIAGTPELARHLRRYELNHRLDADYLRDRHAGEVDDTGWDGVAVMWFDAPADLRAFVAEPARAALTETDTPRFRAPETASVLTRDADVIVERPGGREAATAKLLCILRHHPDLELPAFHDHWLHHHGGLFREHDDLREPLYAYDQNHGIEGPEGRYDGVTEQWFGSLAEWLASLDAPSHDRVVAPDVASLFDLSDIHFVMAGRPTVVIA